MKIDNFARLKQKLFASFTNVKGVLVGRTFFKSHSFEMRRVTNQGGSTLKSDSIFVTHAGEQNTLNSVLSQLLRHKWKKSNLKDVTDEVNIVSADGEVIVSPNNQNANRTYAQMYRFIHDLLIVPGAIALKTSLDAGSWIRTKAYFMVSAKSPRVWLRDSKGRAAGLLYSPNAEATKSYDKRITLVQYGVSGKTWETYLELFSGKCRINGRDILIKERLVSVNKNYTAKDRELVLVDARAATSSRDPKKIYLPENPENGTVVKVKGRFRVGYVFIYGNGKKIESRDSISFYGYRMIEFTYFGEWLITARV